MKRIILLLCIFIFKNTVAQQTWFKLLPGWEARHSVIINDTIVTLGNGDFSFYDFFACVNQLDFNGNLLNTSILNYKLVSGDSYSTSSYWSENDFLTLDSKPIIPLTVTEHLRTGYHRQSYLFSYPELQKLDFNFNNDTAETIITYSGQINKNNYLISKVTIVYNKNISKTGNFIYKVDKDTARLINKHINLENIIHSQDYINLSQDNQNASNLLLTVEDKWDWAFDPQSYQTDIVKMDTTGKVIWRSRPNLNWDSVNTTALQMVQKPNGNILCSWLDLYYRPWKRPDRPYQNADINTRATLWFAEIDYQTGKVLWNKNIRQFLGWKQKQPQASFDYLLMKDVKLMEDNTIVWAGQRGIDAPFQNGYKYMPFLLKTDLQGNPTWYREYDLYPSDTGDRGMQVYSFVQTPDKGFLLTGEYQNKFGQLSNGEAWQKACLLKLDSNGCFEPGCNMSDRIIAVEDKSSVCGVYPNPANEDFTISYPANDKNWQAKIFSTQGQLILQSDNSIDKVNTSTFSNGLYFLELTNTKNGLYEIHKIIIKH